MKNPTEPLKIASVAAFVIALGLFAGAFAAPVPPNNLTLAVENILIGIAGGAFAVAGAVFLSAYLLARSITADR